MSFHVCLIAMWVPRLLPLLTVRRRLRIDCIRSDCLATARAHSCWATRLPAGASFPRRDRRHAIPCRVFTVFLLCQLSMFHAPSCSYYKAFSTSPCARAATRPRFLGAAAGEAPSLRAAQRPSARPAVRQAARAVSGPPASSGPRGGDLPTPTAVFLTSRESAGGVANRQPPFLQAAPPPRELQVEARQCPLWTDS